MKKLMIQIGCAVTIVLMTSCTADSLESSNTESQKNKVQISPSSTTNDKPIETKQVTPGVDDKDKSQG